MDEAEAFLWKNSSNSCNSDMKETFIKDSVGLATVLRMHRALPTMSHEAKRSFTIHSSEKHTSNTSEGDSYLFSQRNGSKLLTQEEQVCMA